MKDERIPVADLFLDPENPRLPEEVRNETQAAILKYLFENAVLDELALSYLNNGFFQHEPLLVAAEGDGYVVLEGNRRVAALKVLLQDADAQENELAFLLDESLSDEARAGLERIPAFEVADRDEVRKYLGFRHIGGIKTWSAEAKARYLAAEVDRVRDDPNPFLEVARRVGSNSQGVRNAYLAIASLRYARDTFGIDVARVQHRRFGVWMRCLNSPDLRKYIGLGDPSTLEDVDRELTSLNREHLAEVLGDLIPQEGRKKALLSDSRQVTVYGQALYIPQAYEAMRRYADFDLARQIVQEAGLVSRVRGLIRALEIILSEATRASQLDPALTDAAEELAQVSQSLSAVVKSKG